MSISAVQMIANRENAQHSTGPRTPDGKQRASLNATRHGLTGQVVVLAHEDLRAYQALHAEMLTFWAPSGIYEQRLVQRLIDTDWRLGRCPSLENGMFAAGNASACPPSELDAALEAARILREDHKALESLGRHETRLSRLYQSILKELKELQLERKLQELSAITRAANHYRTSKMKGIAYDPTADGFVLKNDQIEAWIARDQRQRDSGLAANVRFNLAQFQNMTRAA